MIEKSDREHPADAALRAELKSAKDISREEGGEIAKAVFRYYRWLGWLDKEKPLEAQMKRAEDLDRSFQKNPANFTDIELERAVPSWVKDQMKISPAWLRSLQMEPALWLRARRGKGRELAERLGNCWIAEDPALSDALRYEGSEDLFRAPEFHSGEFELQDISSQAVGWICDPQPGQTWWDACAGEGGKTLHLCDLMQNKGLLWASDRAEWRLKKLKQRAARAKIFNYRTALWEGRAKLPTKTKFDGILVDAPCSGIGTWQRNPQARWTTQPSDVSELSAVQIDLLSNAAVALKPGGRLIYSVCTLTEAETTRVMETISQRFNGLKPLAIVNPFQRGKTATNGLQLRPYEVGGNGMFICGWTNQTASPVR